MHKQPGRPAAVATTFQLVLQNTGSQTTTYDLSLSGLPAGVTGIAQPSRRSRSRPARSRRDRAACPTLTVTLTSTSTTELVPVQLHGHRHGRGSLRRSPSRSPARSPCGRRSCRSPSVTTNPAFTNPGGQVDVSAQILNAVNTQQQARSRTRSPTPANNVLFTSQPVATTLNVLTTLTHGRPGQPRHHRLRARQDTITVTVTDASGNPIPGATGTGTLLIGTPVTATLSTTPTSLPPGNGTVTTTLQINSQTSFTAPLGLVGQAADQRRRAAWPSTAPSPTSAPPADRRRRRLQPHRPDVLSTFGASDFPGMAVVAMQVYNNELVVLAQHSGVTSQSLLIYSLANPTEPDAPGPDAAHDPGEPRFYASRASRSRTIMSTRSRPWFGITSSGGQIFAAVRREPRRRHQQPGGARRGRRDLQRSRPTRPPAIPDGTSNFWQVAAVNNNVLLIGTTTATGSTSTARTSMASSWWSTRATRRTPRSWRS